MISEKKMKKSYLVFDIEKMMEFEKLVCFFVNLLRYSFGRIQAVLNVVEREYTPGITPQICFAYHLNGFCMIRGFTEPYFLTGYSYILENNFYFLYARDYCFKPSLSRIFCVNSFVKVLPLQYEGPLTHLFHTSLLCTFIIYREREIVFVAKFLSKYIFGPKVIPIYMSS